MSPTLHASRVLLARTLLREQEIDVDEEGRILAYRPCANQSTDASTLTPTFLDLHTHGACGHDVMSADAAGFSALQHFLASRGVGFYLPTTVTAGVDTTLHALERMADAIERRPQRGEAQPIGIHLEGPFLSHSKRGVHPVEHLLPPTLSLFDRFQTAARGHIRLITLAPELPGAVELTRYAVAGGVRVSVGHTDATAAETLAVLAAGATGATHIFNAMRALNHREPGVLGVALDDDRLFAEIICDGVHVDPALVRLWLKAKGVARSVLVTDAMAATGQGDGDYTLGGLPVTVAGDRALLTADLANGKQTLAGSLLTMDVAVGNLQRFTGASLADAVATATHSPAALLGRPELTSLEVGTPANFNRFDAIGRLVETYLLGVKVEPSF